MATSGSFDWTLTRDAIITLAYQRCGALEEGDTLSATQITMGATFLESLMKSLGNEGIGGYTFPWTNQSITASSSVTGDTDSQPYRCIYPHTGAAGNKPTTGAQWPVYWIIDQSAAGGSWATSAYTASGVFSLPTGCIGINLAYVLNLGITTPLDVFSAEKYSRVTDKGSKGVPEALYVDREQNVAILWPQPDTASPTYVIRYQAVQLLEDFDSNTYNADLPTRGLEMLSYGLAVDLGMGPLGLTEQRVVLLDNKFHREKLKFKSIDKDYRGNERVIPSAMIV